MPLITSNPLWKLLKRTIDGITTEGLEKAWVAIGSGKLATIESMEDGYADDIEVAGTTLLPEKEEGAPMAVDTITIGGTKRYIPRTMAKKVAISQEALEDNKYAKALQISKRLLASAYKTMDIDVASLVLNCTANTGGYDNVVLASTAHVLPLGGTASNYLNSGLGMTPSPQAVQQMRNMATLMPGPNGLIDTLELKGITFPDIQLDMWKVITGTEKSVGNEFNDINTVAGYGLKLVPVKWFDAVNPDIWGGLTNVDDGFRVLQKRKVTSNTWTANDEMVAFHGVSYRMAMGHSNWRCFILGNI